MTFLERLMPRRELDAESCAITKLRALLRTPRGHLREVPAIVYMCRLPRIHEEADVVFAISRCEDDELFRETGIEAIISFWYVSLGFAQDLRFNIWEEVLWILHGTVYTF